MVKYYCDICKKEINANNGYHEFKLVYTNEYGNVDIERSYKDNMVCHSCRKKLMDYRDKLSKEAKSVS